MGRFSQAFGTFDRLMRGLNGVINIVADAILVESGAAEPISAMPAAGALTGAELVPIVQGGVNVQTTLATVGVEIAATVPAILLEAGAQEKISAMPAAAALTGAETIPGVQGGANVKLTPAQILNYVGPFLTQHPGYIVGHFYSTSTNGNAVGAAIAVNSARFIPFIPEQTCTLSALGAVVTTIGATNFQLAIYAGDPVTKNPTGAVLAATGNLSNTSATGVSGAINLQVIEGTLYWLAICSGDSLATYRSFNAGAFSEQIGTTALLATISNNNLGYSTPMTFGTWSNATGLIYTIVVAGACANIAFNVGSIP